MRLIGLVKIIPNCAEVTQTKRRFHSTGYRPKPPSTTERQLQGSRKAAELAKENKFNFGLWPMQAVPFSGIQWIQKRVHAGQAVLSVFAALREK